MPDPIDYTAIPGEKIDPDAIETNAATVSTISGQVSEHGSNVHFKWQGMAGVYEAPESPTLLGLMAPVSSQATQVSDNLAEVSAALTAFAADVRPIKAELDSLRTQAKTFVDSIQGGVRVQEINPAWTAAQSPYGGATATPTYQGSWGSSTTSSTSTAMPDKYRTVTKEWYEVQEYVDRNNELLSAVNAQQVKLWEAERACANRIRALYGAAPLHAATSEDDALGYGLSEIPEGTEMPWGAEVERTEGCGEATAKFVFKDFLWEGIAVGGVWGTITGLGTLVLGYNPETGDFFSGDAYGAAWGNLGMLVFAGAANTGVLAPIFQSDTLMQTMGMGGFLPQEVRDFKAQADEAAVNTGKALIAWDKWQDDPGTALGESVFNVGTALIPVGGAAVAGVKTASTAASVVSKIAKVADFVDPAAFAMNGAMKLGGAGLKGLDGIIGRLGTDAPGGFHLNTPDMPFVADDATSALRALDDAGVDLNSVTARVEDGIPVYEFPPTDAIPSGRIEMPAGSFDGVRGGDIPVRTDGGADAGVAAPVREPELVSAGGVRGETGPDPVNSIVEDAPVRTETGGAGESTVVREPATETGGGSSHAGGQGGSEPGNGGAGRGGDDASGGGRGDDGTTGSGRGEDAASAGRGDDANGAGRGEDVSDGGRGRDSATGGEPTDGDSATGGPTDDHAGSPRSDGSVEGPTHRGNPVDPHYGEPRADHGTLADQYAPPATVPDRYQHLVTDPNAPYGRADDGHAFSRSEWEERYIGPDNRPIYPGNNGAVDGTRHTFTDMDSFRAAHGDTLDRMGGHGGDFLSPEGVPFEHRALPGSNLLQPYHVFRLADELPDGMRIEVSEVAPAFGQPGGGIQLQFVSDSKVFTVDELLDEVLFPTSPHTTGIDAGAWRISDLQSPVPDAPSISALHAESIPIEMQRSVIRHEYPGMLGINATRFDGTFSGALPTDIAKMGWTENCTRCVVAFDRLMDGAPASAMPSLEPRPVTDIFNALGIPENFAWHSSYGDVANTMSALPEGSRGVVYIARDTGGGHVFNVVHDKNGVVFIDSQTGLFAQLEPDVRIGLIVTKRG
jgi:hypothetical protein